MAVRLVTEKEASLSEVTSDTIKGMFPEHKAPQFTSCYLDSPLNERLIHLLPNTAPPLQLAM